MRSLFNCRVARVMTPQQVSTAGDVASTAIDCAGHTELIIVAELGDTQVGLDALKLQQSDTGSSNWSDISGSDFSASFPNAQDDGDTIRWNVRLKGKKRYLRVYVSGDGSDTEGYFFFAVAILDGGSSAPQSNTQRGADFEKSC